MLIQGAAEYLAPYVPLDLEEIAARLKRPEKPEQGEAVFPCRELAQRLGQSPEQTASDLAMRMRQLSGEVRVEASGPDLHLYLNPHVWSIRILEKALQPDFGSSRLGEGTRVVIDLSSPNIAKPFGVGHLRSTLIGGALAQLYRFSGYEVITVNHLGDWGTHFGKLIAAFKRWGVMERLQQDPVRESLRLYVNFHEAVDEEPELAEEAREWYRKLEKGDAEAESLRTYFVEASLHEFDRVYERLGVTFDHVMGESFYKDRIVEVVSRLKDKGLLEELDGRTVVRLDHLGLPPCPILKADGTTEYSLRDLAAALYRKEELGADRLLYVVGIEQSTHFRQVFAVLSELDPGLAERCEHVAFGQMKFQGRQTSIRRGQVIFLNDVLDEAVAKAERIVAGSNPDALLHRQSAEALGIGSIVFSDLKQERTEEIEFSLDDVLRIDGETGLHMQYTYAKAMGLLETGTRMRSQAELSAQPDPSALSGRLAWECLKRLNGFPDAVQVALQMNEPSLLAAYLLRLARQFNRFYQHETIIGTDPEQTQARLLLTAGVASVLKQGLELLGIRAVAKL
ncbi:arginine--tRNA ligase [Paenibacillus tarimensis]|uniref:arginine--tRNA ligase n=1 Tax=Paenibacillus tarimensis TaxID=416012 RepID=UPI001EFFDB6C|nr:arginine--tRNA ligase [Paenibacillus tarimensis]MCF2945826.1 arginine--tRNA ligase [Paenibacillus tarimensis]